MYVASYIEHLRDGKESGGRIFATKAEALEWINEGNWKRNYTFRLHELGAEITLTTATVEVPQPSVVKTKIVENVT